MEEGLRGDLCSGALAVISVVLIVALVFRLATGMSPWPVFLLAEMPGAGFGFILLALSSPHLR